MDCLRCSIKDNCEGLPCPDHAPVKLLRIGESLRTQDNRITDQPIFVVEESVMVITDPNYGHDKETWIHPDRDYEEADDLKAKRLDILAEAKRDTRG